MPDRNTEYLYYQTLIGAWPLPVDRAQAYMTKATREAKQQTSWVANNKDFEDALNRFIERTLGHAPFVKEVEQFVEKIKLAGWVNSLAQTLMKHTAPGVPDLYQGTELWDLSLVDPDNRRPVDYKIRRRLLAELKALNGENPAVKVMMGAEEGLPKLWTIYQGLQLRGKRPEWFGAEAGYTPLPVEGAKSDHVIAYMRGDTVATVVPRLTMKLGGAWRRTTVTLPDGRWMNRMTNETVEGGKVAVEMLLKDFPVALLVRDEAEEKSNA
jgi:(1->4)-alpha-D-glucan 1-alpha-D-glucosylmutase